MVNWERFDVDGAEDLPDSYTQEDRYCYQASLGNLMLSVGACYYNDLFVGWGWHIESNGKPIVEFTFRSHRDAFGTSWEARSSAILYVRQFFPEEWDRHQAGVLFQV